MAGGILHLADLYSEGLLHVLHISAEYDAPARRISGFDSEAMLRREGANGGDCVGVRRRLLLRLLTRRRMIVARKQLLRDVLRRPQQHCHSNGLSGSSGRDPAVARK